MTSFGANYLRCRSSGVQGQRYAKHLKYAFTLCFVNFKLLCVSFSNHSKSASKKYFALFISKLTLFKVVTRHSLLRTFHFSHSRLCDSVPACLFGCQADWVYILRHNHSHVCSRKSYALLSVCLYFKVIFMMFCVDVPFTQFVYIYAQPRQTQPPAVVVLY